MNYKNDRKSRKMKVNGFPFQTYPIHRILDFVPQPKLYYTYFFGFKLTILPLTFNSAKSQPFRSG